MNEEFSVGQAVDVVDFDKLLNSLVPIAIRIVSFFIKQKRKGRNTILRIRVNSNLPEVKCHHE
jgi:hypothetical protein